MPRRALVHFEAAGLTDQGRSYPVNQDSFLVRPDLGVFAVADGMSRPAGGGLAASLAIRTLAASFERSGRWKPCAEKIVRKRRRLLARSFAAATTRVLDVAAREPQHTGMGTTLAALAVAGNKVLLAHVGDSRVYRLRGTCVVPPVPRRGRAPLCRTHWGHDDCIERLTVDHSVREDPAYSARREANPSLESSPEGQVLTQVIGHPPPLRVPLRVEVVRPDDVYLLCTDGVYGMVDDNELCAVLRDPWGVRDAASKRLGRHPGKSTAELQCAWAIQRGLRRGGYDNLTIVVVRFPPPRPRASVPLEPEPSVDDEDVD